MLPEIQMYARNALETYFGKHLLTRFYKRTFSPNVKIVLLIQYRVFQNILISLYSVILIIYFWFKVDIAHFKKGASFFPSIRI